MINLFEITEKSPARGAFFFIFSTYDAKVSLIEIKLNTPLENTGKIFISLVLQTNIVL